MTTAGPSSSARPPPRASSSPWRSSASSARCCRCSPCASAFGSLRCRAIVRGGHARSRRSGSEIVIEGVLSKAKAARKRRRSHQSRGSGPTAGRRRSSARRSSRARDRTRRRRRGGTGAEAAPGTRPTPVTTRCVPTHTSTPFTRDQMPVRALLPKSWNTQRFPPTPSTGVRPDGLTVSGQQRDDGR